jgi:hypothetical protein
VPYEEPLKPIAVIDSVAFSPDEAGELAAEAIFREFGG